MPARRAVVTGCVQGVGFRAFVRDLARSLGMDGEVWNRHDGAVEMIYSHDSAHVLAEFEGRLPSGPGKVDRVATHDHPFAVEAAGFRVISTRP